MATIMEGTTWTLTEAAAERMFESGLIVKCSSQHCNKEAVDGTIYHIDDFHAPAWFGVHSLEQAIRSAEEHVILTTFEVPMETFDVGLKLNPEEVLDAEAG